MTSSGSFYQKDDYLHLLIKIKRKEKEERKIRRVKIIPMGHIS